MTDPLYILVEPVVSVAPSPEFTQELRARLERALEQPRGVGMIDASTEATPEVRPAAVPYLVVSDARAAIAWYAEVLGAEVVGDPIVMDDARIGHSELRIGAGVIYLADAFPDIGAVAPRPGERSVSLMLPVADVDDVRRRALAAGAVADREPYNGYGQRNAWIYDPFGHHWGLNGPER